MTKIGRVLIAGSADTDSVKKGHVVSKKCEYQQGAKGDLKGPIIDVANMEKLFLAHDQTLGLTQTRTSRSFRESGQATSVDQVRDAISTVMMDPEADVVELFYSGHGVMLKGTWCFENCAGKVTDYITFEDITAMWKRARASYPRKIKLYLICDCCFSGAWVRAAEQLNDPTVCVRASCGETEVSWDSASGGKFTKELVRLAYAAPRPTLSGSMNQGVRKLFSGSSLQTCEPQTPCIYFGR
jgi:hypothetical protein